jgi:hypothetical protein
LGWESMRLVILSFSLFFLSSIHCVILPYTKLYLLFYIFLMIKLKTKY